VDEIADNLPITSLIGNVGGTPTRAFLNLSGDVIFNIACPPLFIKQILRE